MVSLVSGPKQFCGFQITSHFLHNVFERSPSNVVRTFSDVVAFVEDNVPISLMSYILKIVYPILCKTEGSRPY